MVKIKNVNVCNLQKSVLRSGLPMSTGEPEDLKFNERVKIASKLGSVKTGTGHDNYLKGIIVNFDIKYPEYFSPQLQRYSWIDIVSSQSKMHRLTKMDVDKSVNKYVDQVVIDNLNEWIEIYNNFPKDKNYASRDFDEIVYVPRYIQTLPEGYDRSFTWYTKYEVFMKIISNCPLGFEKWMNISTNYLQLKTILQQRENHGLEEDWREFCNFIKKLPMFKELVFGKA